MTQERKELIALAILFTLVGVGCGGSLAGLYLSNRIVHRLDMQINSCVAIEGKLDLLLDQPTPQPQPQPESFKDGRDG